MAQEKFKNTSTIKIDTTLNVLKVDETLYAYRLSRRATIVDSAGPILPLGTDFIKTKEHSGICDVAGLEKLKLTGECTSLNLRYLTIDEQELARLNGWVWWSQKHIDISSRNVFKLLCLDDKNSNLNPNVLVNVDLSSHLMFDRFGNPLPIAIEWDYISHGRVTDANYELPKLAEYLMEREDCIVYAVDKTGYRKDEVNRTVIAASVDDAIANIPYYNSEPGRSKTIYWRWQPTAEVFADIWRECNKINKKYPSTAIHEAIWNLDSLGLRKAGIALNDEYYTDNKYGSEV